MSSSRITDLRSFVDVIFWDLIVAALPVITGLALLIFLWGLVKFIFRIGGDEKAVADGKKLMIWGLIAIFILVSFRAIIAFFHTDIGFGPLGVPVLPPYGED